MSPTRELKTGSFVVKKVDDRTVTGIFSVMGNLDSYNDVIWPGAFSKTFQERAGKVLHLWQHDFESPPIAVVKSLREISRDELPPQVLEAAPEALGGAEVVREYLDTPRASEVLAGIKAGAPLQMSFAYDAVKYDFQELPGAKYEWERQRNLRELRLYETSDVLFGANDATLASKSLRLPLDVLLKQLGYHLDEWLSEGKEGRRNATGDQARINTIAKLAIELGADNVKLAEPGEQEDEGKQDDTGKTSSRAAAESVALTVGSYRQLLELRKRALLLAESNGGI
jgi:HK97 family phage prohead protease